MKNALIFAQNGAKLSHFSRLTVKHVTPTHQSAGPRRSARNEEQSRGVQGIDAGPSRQYERGNSEAGKSPVNPGLFLGCYNYLMKHLQMLLQMFDSELKWIRGHEGCSGRDRQYELGFAAGMEQAMSLTAAVRTTVEE